jgi:Skp family chaperone for outer membrane proteins
MKRSLTNRSKAAYVATTILMLAAAGVFAPAYSQDAPGNVIGFVNLQVVGQKAKAAIGAGEKIDSYRRTVEGKIRAREDALRQEEKALGRRRSILAPDAFRDEETRFREKVDLAQREFQQVGRQLQQATAEAQQAINLQMSAVIRDIAVEQGINIVLNQGQVTFIQPLDQFDITDAVIARMNEVLPEISVNLPQE